MDSEKPKRRGRVPFAERLAELDRRVVHHQRAIAELNTKKQEMVEAQRKVVAALQDELPTDVDGGRQ